MEFNWIAIGFATVAGIAVGSLWFGPRTFFPVWWKALGKSPEEQPGTSNMFAVFGLTALAVIAQAVILALVLNAVGMGGVDINWFTGLSTGALLGVGFAAAPALSHKLFGGFRIWVWVLEAGQDIMSLAVMGAILGALN